MKAVDQSRHGRRRPSVENLFSFLTTVRPGEGAGVALLFGAGFLMMFSYYILKTLREALILSASTAEIKSYAVAAVALVLFFAVPLYSAIFRNTNRTQLVYWTNTFFLMNLGVFYLMRSSGLSIGFLYYTWVGVFGVMVVAQFWAYVTDIYNVKSGQRLFPAIVAGTSVGALAGSKFSQATFMGFGSHGLMLVAGIALVASTLLYRPARRAAPEDSRCVDCEFVKPRFENVLGGFAIVGADTYLRLIALFIVLLNWVNSTGEFILSELVVQWADQVIAEGQPGVTKVGLIAAFYGNMNFSVTLLGLLLQIFIVARVFRAIGVEMAILILPIVAVVGYSLVVFVPIFSMIRLVKILENGTDYSIMNTVRQALFLPTSREVKFEGKMAIDTFFWRFGDLIQGGFIFVGLNWFEFGVREFAILNLLLGIIWIGLAVTIGRHYRRLIRRNVSDEAPLLNNPIQDLTLTARDRIDFTLRPDTFVRKDPGDVIRLRARQPDGSPLPGWLRFDANRGRFTGYPPANFRALAVLVEAKDHANLVATDTFAIRAPAAVTQDIWRGTDYADSKPFHKD